MHLTYLLMSDGVGSIFFITILLKTLHFKIARKCSEYDLREIELTIMHPPERMNVLADFIQFNDPPYCLHTHYKHTFIFPCVLVCIFMRESRSP